ncbi:hypothetical protein [Knoellia subterranea]|uniref:Uncharacterized protein n=1 Tax=Knoellia subterranea KCTC 19937 TaxID=1385521 RepID=A0A0A0JGS7_9MICO|nr:hypothetical protein [Knoellia subterranea]KGN36348.1 hypothetical protein N803_05960 [Knoellia subterranea KCTC 19937]
MASQRADLWDRFVDEALPYVGLPELPDRLRIICPNLTSREVDSWVARFNTANSHPSAAAGSSSSLCLTDDEADGIWYDRMKSVAFDFIEEVETHGA